MTNEPQDLMESFSRLMHSRFFMAAMSMNMRTKRGSDKELGRGRLRLLSLLNKEDGLTNAEIAEKLDIRPSSVSAQVTSLVETGMIERRASENDGRVSLIFITDAGKETLAGLHNGNDEMSERAFSVLTEAEQAQLKDMLRRIAANTEDIEMDPEMLRDAFGPFAERFQNMDFTDRREMRKEMHKMHHDLHKGFKGWF